jgi:hypothetical protein
MSLLAAYGVRSFAQVRDDLGKIFASWRDAEGFDLDLTTAGLFRADLSLAAYAGRRPADGRAPIYNLFDRTGGGESMQTRVTRRRMRDYRGGRLSYDDHDGTDFVCPPGTPLVAAASGTLVAVRDNWVGGGLSAMIDHGRGVVTQYSHLSRLVAEIGAPLSRGEAFAESGTSGIDLLVGAPWIPPHVHFTVWVSGRPVDPYNTPGESRDRSGLWMHHNDPAPARGPAANDLKPELDENELDAAAIDAVIGACSDAKTRGELRAASSPAMAAALLEDRMHRDRRLWPEHARRTPLRRPADDTRVMLTLPLPADRYVGARCADAPWTRPS